MRRLLALPLAAAAFAVAAPAPAAQAVPCYGTTDVGVCAGIECNDLCGPILVVDPYCRHDDPAILACRVVDRLYFSTRNK
ncbi:MAG: hypothetical protein QOE45_1688 [Frankiaceae bacterium]|jgi:hypothetical protein|nr:hypothetical protein [Frankiaceae bacterium]